MIDVTHQISAVDRRVGTRVLAAGEARTIEISQVYDATVDEVWDACTNAERIPRWFLLISSELTAPRVRRLQGLSLHGASRAAVDPAEVAAWSASDEGRLFMQRSGEAWRDAHLAAGNDPEAAAARSTAAYTGPPEGDAAPTGEDGQP
jgi:hypothetical protein